MLAKQAAEGVSPDDHEKCISRGGIRQWVKWRKKEYVKGEDGGGVD